MRRLERIEFPILMLFAAVFILFLFTHAALVLAGLALLGAVAALINVTLLAAS